MKDGVTGVSKASKKDAARVAPVEGSNTVVVGYGSRFGHGANVEELMFPYLSCNISGLSKLP